MFLTAGIPALLLFNILRFELNPLPEAGLVCSPVHRASDKRGMDSTTVQLSGGKRDLPVINRFSHPPDIFGYDKLRHIAPRASDKT